MLESFDQNMQRIPPQGEIFDNTQSGSNKPVSKTTTKTEVSRHCVLRIVWKQRGFRGKKATVANTAQMYAKLPNKKG